MNITRRTFLGTASAGVMAASAFGQTTYAATSESDIPSATFSKTRILRIYLGGRAGWPSLLVDPDAEMKRIQQEIDKLPGLEDIEFVGNVRITNPGGRMIGFNVIEEG